MRFLGGAEIFDRGVPVPPGTGTRAVLLLLAYLALHEDRGHTRSHLAAVLWPDSLESQARVNLRGTLHRLRRAFPGIERWIALDEPQVHWRRTHDVDSDLWRFRDGARAGSLQSLQAACAAYRGELLPGFEDEWVVRAREDLQREYTRVLERIVDLLQGARQYEAAVAYAELLHRQDPLHEPFVRRLMHAHALSANPAAAERVYKTWSEQLKRELNCEPSSETAELARRLRASARAARETAGNAGAASSHPTLHESVHKLESDLFVGRARELAAFRQWLLSTSETPKLLVVHGPGGVGKTTLLRAFADTARLLGWSSRTVNSAVLAGSRQSLLNALGGRTESAVVARLNRTRPLLLLDTCEELAELNRYLREQLLPQLDNRIPVVFAGRFKPELEWSLDSPWRRVVRTMPVQALNREEAETYLTRRGVTDAKLLADIVEITHGSPLGLSLAADLAVDLGVRDFRAVAPRWRFTVHELIGELLREVREPQLQQLLEAASVLRQFDEGALLAVSGLPEVGPAYERLARLSVVRNAEFGLALHDDVRALMAKDLEWRNRERWAALRLRALEYYRWRAAQPVTPEERQWIFNERLFLWSHALAHDLLFREAEPGLMWVERGRPEDWPAVLRVWRQWMTEFLRATPTEGLRQALEQALHSHCFRLRIVRHRDGDVLGFSGAIAICRESLPILMKSPNTAALVRARWSNAELDALPQTADDARAVHLRYAAHGVREADAVRAFLLRELLTTLTFSATYYVTTGLPAYQKLVEAMGFRRLPEARYWSEGATNPDESYELDLSEIGFEAWVAELVRGRSAAQDWSTGA